MQRFQRFVRGILGAAAALLLVAAVPAAADDDGEGACASECSEARRVCRGAAHAAWRACADDCGDAVREAARHAREACDAGDLATGECLRLIRSATADALRACRDDCKAEREIASALCQDERGECRSACVAGLDPACVDGCQGAFETCRASLEACSDGCAASFETARAACATSSVVEGACDAAAYRECVATARADAAACRHACHEASPCAGDLRQCLGDCPPAESPPAP
jgi:hypothetical protein